MARLPGPVRTCVGCRTRAAKSTLLRVVAVGGVLTPDPAGRLPGRGASVHPDPRCVDLAEKRRAFPRALRLAGPLDLTPVRECLAQDGRSTPQDGTTGSTSTSSRTSTRSTTGPRPPGGPPPDAPPAALPPPESRSSSPMSTR